MPIQRSAAGDEMEPVKRASVYTLGCRLNQAETRIIVERLQAAGYQIVPFGEPADLGIINTCTVTREADAKSRKAVKGFVRKNPEAFTAAVGCYAELASETLARIAGVDAIVGTRDKLDLLAYVQANKNDRPRVFRHEIEPHPFKIETTGKGRPQQRANLKIQEGCSCMCSYCIVPYARGRPRSRELCDAIDEARALVAEGTREIVLTGVNVGLYHHEGAALLDVIDALDEIPDLPRIRISSIELTTIPEGLFERMAARDHALVPFLHVPLQSGSDRVLGRMARPYSGRDFLRLAEEACSSVPGLCFGTDVLVGMPGEGDDDFQITLEVLEKAPVAYAHVFRYSPRPGTPAAAMPDQVEAQVSAARSQAVRRLSARKRRKFHEKHLGVTMEVLFEQRDSDSGDWSGYTGNYIRVLAPAGRDLTNALRPVVLEASDGEWVRGRLAARAECPCPRARTGSGGRE